VTKLKCGAKIIRATAPCGGRSLLVPRIGRSGFGKTLLAKGEKVFNRKPKSRLVGQKAVMHFSDRGRQQQQIDALTPLAVSVQASQKAQEAIKAGVDAASAANVQPLVRTALDGGHNEAMQRAGASQRRDDATEPKGPDLTRDTRRVGEYAKQVKGDEHEGVPDVTRLNDRAMQNYQGTIADSSRPERASTVSRDAGALGTADNPTGRTVVKDIVYDEYSRKHTAQGRGP
jgi:hypothetical protein